MLHLSLEINKCENCILHRTRQNAVPGEGPLTPDIVICGEAPGAEEDESGQPFVGRAGKLLNEILVAAGIHRDDVFILNAIKCRPPRNRRPFPQEIESCKPFLIQQLTYLNPKVIIAMGNCALEALTGKGSGVLTRCGVWESYNGIKLMPCLHPSYILRTPESKDKAIKAIRTSVEYIRG